MFRSGGGEFESYWGDRSPNIGPPSYWWFQRKWEGKEESSMAARHQLIAPLTVDSMKLLFWNVRRAGKPSFITIFWRFVLQRQPEMCIPMETRLSGSSLDPVLHWFPPSLYFYAMDSQGLSKGIIVIWKLVVAICGCLSLMPIINYYCNFLI